MQSYVSLGHREAALATDAIREELARTERVAVIAVADAHGELISLVRLDGAPLASIVIAANKAWTAARERKPTRVIGQAARDPESGFDIAYYGDPRYVGWGGGVPAVIDGAVVGSVETFQPLSAASRAISSRKAQRAYNPIALWPAPAKKSMWPGSASGSTSNGAWATFPPLASSATKSSV